LARLTSRKIPQSASWQGPFCLGSGQSTLPGGLRQATATDRARDPAAGQTLPHPTPSQSLPPPNKHFVRQIIVVPAVIKENYTRRAKNAGKLAAGSLSPVYQIISCRALPIILSDSLLLCVADHWGVLVAE
jgi:hypothetical protein